MIHPSVITTQLKLRAESSHALWHNIKWVSWSSCFTTISHRCLKFWGYLIHKTSKERNIEEKLMSLILKNYLIEKVGLLDKRKTFPKRYGGGCWHLGGSGFIVMVRVHPCPASMQPQESVPSLVPEINRFRSPQWTARVNQGRTRHSSLSSCWESEHHPFDWSASHPCGRGQAECRVGRGE